MKRVLDIVVPLVYNMLMFFKYTFHPVKTCFLTAEVAAERALVPIGLRAESADAASTSPVESPSSWSTDPTPVFISFSFQHDCAGLNAN